ncbi:alpha/beta-hydrolase [Crassisporium funariophilum]|nr:alpha/beta-hydrolase [Crassisporium funariophilum]
MLPTSVAGLLVSFLSLFTGNTPDTAQQLHETPKLQFELRQLHAISSSNAHVIFSDVSRNSLQTFSDPSGSTKPTYSVGSRLTTTYRPSSFAAHSRARLRSLYYGENEWLDWNEEEIESPDVESRGSLLELAKMTNNAYVEPSDPAWYDLDPKWNNSHPFGFEPDQDGFRGQVFATPDNSTVVVSIKGTSAGLFGGGGPTTKKDKINDNLLFSCCCARVDWTWTTVCGCYRGGWKCDQNCLEESLITESLFYPIGTNLYNNLTYMYPDSNIWLIGHSLGGALASLLGVTFGVPVVTFETPGERLAASRLHLPSPVRAPQSPSHLLLLTRPSMQPSTHHVTHVYHTADPIAMGTCNGVLSSCAIGGYAMETRCHMGKSIVYDTVSNASWTVDIRTHGIVNVIERLLSEPWPPSEEIGREVPEAVPDVDCVECYSWDFGDYPA